MDAHDPGRVLGVPDGLRVRLVPGAVLWVEHGTVQVGAALWACLDLADLRDLVAGAVGRTRTVGARVEGRLHTVRGAWHHVVNRLVLPAHAAGVRHAGVHAGTRALLEGWVEHDLVDAPWSGDGSRTGRLDTTTDDRLSADLLPGDGPLLPWDAHPAAVGVPAWRATFAAGVAAATRATGRPVPASLAGLVDVVASGWADATEAELVRRDDLPPGVDATLDAVLDAAAALAVLDAGGSAAWAWPFGSQVVDRAGEVLVLPLSAEPDEPDEPDEPSGPLAALAAHALAEVLVHGGDPARPLWLEAPREPTARSGHAWAGLAGVAPRVLVVTDHRMVVAPATWREVGRRGRAEQVLEEVLDGHSPPGTQVLDLDAVVGAELRPRLRGRAWRLAVRTPTARVVLTVPGSSEEVAPVLRAYLGDRLRDRAAAERDYRSG